MGPLETPLEDIDMKIVRNLLAVGFALSLLAPVAAQQGEPAPPSEKPAVTNPAPTEPAPSLDAESSKDPKAPRPDLNTPPAQYDDTSSTSNEEKTEDKSKSDDNTLPTYNKEADAAGKNQDLPAETYDKKPDPSGSAQKLDAVRYDEQNKDNDGKTSELEVKVLEGEIKE